MQDVDEEVVDNSLTTEHGQPRDDANDVRDPEWCEYDDEECNLELDGLYTARKKERDGIANQDAECSHQQRSEDRVFQRVEIDAGLEQTTVRVKREREGLEANRCALPDRYEHDHQEWGDQEEQQPDRAWQNPGECHQGRASWTRRCDDRGTPSHQRICLCYLRERLIKGGVVVTAQGDDRPQLPT